MAISTVEHISIEPQAVASEPSPRAYRAAVVHDFHSPLSVEQVPAAELTAGQVRVRVVVAGSSAYRGETAAAATSRRPPR